MLTDTIIGILLAIYSASISALFTKDSQLLGAWVIACTLVVLVPVLWWMPFVSEKKAEEIALEYARTKHTDAFLEGGRRSGQAKLDGWKWYVTVSYYKKISDCVRVEVIVNAKCGNVEAPLGLD